MDRNSTMEVYCVNLNKEYKKYTFVFNCSDLVKANEILISLASHWDIVITTDQDGQVEWDLGIKKSYNELMNFVSKMSTGMGEILSI